MWPGARTPPTEPLKSVSPVNSACSAPWLTSSETIPAVWPGVCSGSIRRPPTMIGSPGTISPVACGTSSRSSAWISTGVPGWRSSTSSSAQTWS